MCWMMWYNWCASFSIDRKSNEIRVKRHRHSVHKIVTNSVRGLIRAYQMNDGHSRNTTKCWWYAFSINLSSSPPTLYMVRLRTIHCLQFSHIYSFIYLFFRLIQTQFHWIHCILVVKMDIRFHLLSPFSFDHLFKIVV